MSSLDVRETLTVRPGIEEVGIKLLKHDKVLPFRHRGEQFYFVYDTLRKQKWVEATDRGPRTPFGEYSTTQGGSANDAELSEQDDYLSKWYLKNEMVNTVTTNTKIVDLYKTYIQGVINTYNNRMAQNFIFFKRGGQRKIFERNPDPFNKTNHEKALENFVVRRYLSEDCSYWWFRNLIYNQRGEIVCYKATHSFYLDEDSGHEVKGRAVKRINEVTDPIFKGFDKRDGVISTVVSSLSNTDDFSEKRDELYGGSDLTYSAVSSEKRTIFYDPTGTLPPLIFSSSPHKIISVNSFTGGIQSTPVPEDYGLEYSLRDFRGEYHEGISWGLRGNPVKYAVDKDNNDSQKQYVPSALGIEAGVWENLCYSWMTEEEFNRVRGISLIPELNTNIEGDTLDNISSTGYLVFLSVAISERSVSIEPNREVLLNQEQFQKEDAIKTVASPFVGPHVNSEVRREDQNDAISSQDGNIIQAHVSKSWDADAGIIALKNTLVTRTDLLKMNVPVLIKDSEGRRPIMPVIIESTAPGNIQYYTSAWRWFPFLKSDAQTDTASEDARLASNLSFVRLDLLGDDVIIYLGRDYIFPGMNRWKRTSSSPARFDKEGVKFDYTRLNFNALKDSDNNFLKLVFEDEPNTVPLLGGNAGHYWRVALTALGRTLLANYPFNPGHIKTSTIFSSSQINALNIPDFSTLNIIRAEFELAAIQNKQEDDKELSLDENRILPILGGVGTADVISNENEVIVRWANFFKNIITVGTNQGTIVLRNGIRSTVIADTELTGTVDFKTAPVYCLDNEYILFRDNREVLYSRQSFEYRTRRYKTITNSIYSSFIDETRIQKLVSVSSLGYIFMLLDGTLLMGTIGVEDDNVGWSRIDVGFSVKDVHSHDEVVFITSEDRVVTLRMGVPRPLEEGSKAIVETLSPVAYSSLIEDFPIKESMGHVGMNNIKIFGRFGDDGLSYPEVLDENDHPIRSCRGLSANTNERKRLCFAETLGNNKYTDGLRLELAPNTLITAMVFDVGTT